MESQRSFIYSDIDFNSKSFSPNAFSSRNSDFLRSYRTTRYENENNEVISLGVLSICQGCGFEFNKSIRLPLIFKCGHYFCKDCILTKYLVENLGIIKCPFDSFSTSSINDLKIYDNLIMNNNNNDLNYEKKNLDYQITNKKINFHDNDKVFNTNINFINKIHKESLDNDKDIIPYKNDGDYCNFHKNQKICYFIEDLNQLACVYCAFEKFRLNPSFNIIELNEKLSEISQNLLSMLSKNYLELKSIIKIQNDVEKNKIEQEKKIQNYFHNLMIFIRDQQEKFLGYVNKINNDNQNLIEKLIDDYNEKIEILEVVNSYFEEINNGNTSSIIDSFNSYYLMLSEFENYQKDTFVCYNHIDFQEISLENIFNTNNNSLNDLNEKLKKFIKSVEKKRYFGCLDKSIIDEKNFDKKEESKKDIFQVKNKEKSWRENNRDSNSVNYKKIRNLDPPKNTRLNKSSNIKKNIPDFDRTLNLKYHKIINSSKEETKINTSNKQDPQNSFENSEAFLETMRKKRIEGRNKKKPSI